MELYYNCYLASNGNLKYRYITTGIWTYDLKEQLKILSDEPENVDHHRIIIRSNDTSKIPIQNRKKEGYYPYVCDSSIKVDSIAKYDRINLLGSYFRDYNNGKFPSMNILLNGLLTEQDLQLCILNDVG